jgi:hypothetical protein
LFPKLTSQSSVLLKTLLVALCSLKNLLWLGINHDGQQPLVTVAHSEAVIEGDTGSMVPCRC